MLEPFTFREALGRIMHNHALHLYRVPISPADLQAIAELLRARDVFTPTFLDPEVDRYDAAVYRYQAAQFDTSTTLLVDRNVLTRLVDLVRGVKPTAEHRLAAGVLAFAQCAGIDVEPNIALYELACLQGHAAAVEELRVFRIADHVHPGYWADVALSREDRIGPPLEDVPIERANSAIDFSIRLRRWRRNYVLCLKIAESELQGGDAIRRMSDLIAWMYRDFLLGGPALILAAHYLAPNAERKRLLKGLRSPDRARAIAGVRNAAWDLTLVSALVNHVETQRTGRQLTLLTSFDRGIHRLARCAVDVEGRFGAFDDCVHAFFVDLWGEAAGHRLATETLEAYALRDDPERQLHRPVHGDFIGSCIKSGEAAIRRWIPRK